MNGEWISTTDAALRLKVTPRHIRNKMMEIYQSGSDGVRKVVGSRGNPRWELNEDILHLFPQRGNKPPTKGKLKRKNKEELKGEISSNSQAEATPPIAEVITEQVPQNIGEPLGLGMHIQDDGTVAQIFTMEEFDTFRERLIELPIVKKTLSELKDSYEAHIQTYRYEMDYLRKSLDRQHEMTQRLTSIIQERNFIEASEIIKDRE